MKRENRQDFDELEELEEEFTLNRMVERTLKEDG